MPLRFRSCLNMAMLLCPASLVGCASPGSRAFDRGGPGQLWLLPGIEGSPVWMQAAARGLRDAGFDGQIRIFDWGRPVNRMANLTDHAGNLRKANGIALEMCRYRAANPDDPIDVIGYSGGGGLALMVARALPTHVRLRNVILAQPATDPELDLTPVLEQLDGRLVNLYCPSDWLILGLGTSLFGTMERTYGPSAGKDGFDVERAVPDPALRKRLVQQRWAPDMVASGHPGDHAGVLAYGWNRRYVAPYIVAPQTAGAVAANAAAPELTPVAVRPD